MQSNLLIKGIIVITLVAILLLANVFFDKYIRTNTPEEKLDHKKETFLIKSFRILSLFLAIIIGIMLLFELAPEDLWIFFTSVFAIIGIALFAGWSLLSNITAAFILYYSSDIHIGDSVHYRDGDNSVKGKVVEMSLFFIRIKEAEGNIATIPNNIAMQKVILKINA